MVYLWVAFFVLAVAIYLLDQIRFKDNRLPGPAALPLVGNIFQIISVSKVAKNPLSAFAEMYGEIYRIKVPRKELVVLSSFEAISEVLSKEAALGRDVGGIIADRNYEQNLGIVFAEGAVWDKTRKWTVRNLRDFGFGKSSFMETSVKSEVQLFLETVRKSEKDGRLTFNVSDGFLINVNKVVWTMLVGHCTPEEIPILINLNTLTSDMGKRSGFAGSSAGTGLALLFPFLRKIFPHWTGRFHMFRIMEAFQQTAKKLLQEAKDKFLRSGRGGSEATSLTEKYVQKMKAGDSDSNIFTDLHFEIMFTDLIQASLGTTNAYLEALTLFTVLYPDVQAKIHEEIRSIVANGTEIDFDDKKKLVYTHAVMLEVHRHQMVAQNLVPRRAMKDFYYKKYLIKKNSILVADLNTAYKNNEIWEDPLAFKPERFLTSDGECINGKLEKYIIPFGVGGRICPGEQLANITAFLFFVNIIQNYKLSVIPGEPKPSAEMHVGFTSRPQPFQVVMSKRNTTENK